MTLEILENELSVCKVTQELIPQSGVCFYSRTDSEFSLVCETRFIDFDTIQREDGWRALRIAGTLDFSLIGILSRITAILAEYKIGVFCISTFNTDYVLVKNTSLQAAIEALVCNGYVIEYM